MADLRGILYVDLMAQSIINHVQHKLNERGSITLLRTLVNSQIVLLLVLMYQAFYWNIGKYGLPLRQNQGLPQPPNTSIPIRKWMNKLEFIVKNTTTNQWMLLTVL